MAAVVGNIYTREQVSEHCGPNSCWLVINNSVYDVTEFLNKHPGGEEIVLEYAGSDATGPFTDKGHSKDAYYILSEYRIGHLVEKEHV